MGGKWGASTRTGTHADTGARWGFAAAAFRRPRAAANPGPRRKPRPRPMETRRGEGRAAIGRPGGRDPERRARGGAGPARGAACARPEPDPGRGGELPAVVKVPTTIFAP